MIIRICLSIKDNYKCFRKRTLEGFGMAELRCGFTLTGNPQFLCVREGRYVTIYNILVFLKISCVALHDQR